MPSPNPVFGANWCPKCIPTRAQLHRDADVGVVLEDVLDRRDAGMVLEQVHDLDLPLHPLHLLERPQVRLVNLLRVGGGRMHLASAQVAGHLGLP
jgi:hypothetical protein